jgi:hypothetical protein
MVGMKRVGVGSRVLVGCSSAVGGGVLLAEAVVAVGSKVGNAEVEVASVVGTPAGTTVVGTGGRSSPGAESARLRKKAPTARKTTASMTTNKRTSTHPPNRLLFEPA